jgi:hypothetical protein
MDLRCPRFLLLPAIAGLVVLSGCIGKSTSNPGNGGVRTVTLSPSTTISLEFGRTQNFSAAARNSAGQTVFTTIHFLSDNNAALTISNNGVACAGTWDSLSNPVRCSPGVEGIANVTAEAEGVSSPPTTIYVHQHIQSIQVTPVTDPTDDCFSQGVISDFQAKAYGANQADITNSVGPINWSSTTANVLTTSTADLPNNQVRATAKTPGITQLFASSSGTVSSPFNYTTCLVKSVHLQVQGSTDNSTTLNAGGAKTLVATVLDTLGVELTKPPITFSSSNPEIATVNSGGTVTARQNSGTADISASCTPPTCNIGVLPGLPIYSTGGTLPNGQAGFGLIIAHVTQTKPPTATAWTATTDCGANFNCTSAMFPVATGANPVGTAVGVPYTPNSLLFNPAGTRVYMGSDKGLMFVDVGAQNPAVNTVSQATTPCNVAICGKPLAISADGNRVVVSDTTTDPNQVYIFNAASPTNPPVDLLINGATAAAFSPDQMKIFILTDTGRLSVFSTVDALTSVPLPGSATGLAFSGDGSFAYLLGTPLGNTISGLATCDAQPTLAEVPTPPNFDFVATPGVPLKIFASPDAQRVMAVDPPFIDMFSTSHTILPLPDNQFVCDGRNLSPPGVYIDPTVNFPQSVQTFNLGQGTFTPLFMQMTGDGSQIIIVAQNIPAVLIFDISGGTTTAIPLANNASPLAASATQDGTQVFVAACDADPVNPNTCGSVHIVNTQTGGDLQQAVYTNFNTNDSLCNNLPGPPCLPNLIAVRPQ